ncbi:MAG: polyphenol oxidase, partial [Sphingopyxis sp.]
MNGAGAVPQFTSAALAGVPHAFLGRAGGLSDGLYGGRNVGPGATPDWPLIERNRQRAVDAVLPGAGL